MATAMLDVTVEILRRSQAARRPGRRTRTGQLADGDWPIRDKSLAPWVSATFITYSYRNYYGSFPWTRGCRTLLFKKLTVIDAPESVSTIDYTRAGGNTQSEKRQLLFFKVYK